MLNKYGKIRGGNFKSNACKILVERWSSTCSFKIRFSHFLDFTLLVKHSLINKLLTRLWYIYMLLYINIDNFLPYA